jgi:transcription initiation factor TFIID subunit TAF12
MVLGGGLEPPRLAAYAPQTYVSAISPPELVQGREMINTTYRSRKADYCTVGTSSPARPTIDKELPQPKASRY